MLGRRPALSFAAAILTPTGITTVIDSRVGATHKAKRALAEGMCIRADFWVTDDALCIQDTASRGNRVLDGREHDRQL